MYRTWPRSVVAAVWSVDEARRFLESARADDDPGLVTRSTRATSTATSRRGLRPPTSQLISVHATRRTCASLLVALDVHPRVAMAILRHSQVAVTMDIYSRVSSASTREALKRLGNQLGEGSA